LLGESFKWNNRSTNLPFSAPHFLLITAFLGNPLIQVALYKESSLHPPTKFLLRTLSASDLCDGLTGNPPFVTFLLSSAKERWNICRSVMNTGFPVGNFLCGRQASRPVAGGQLQSVVTL